MENEHQIIIALLTCIVLYLAYTTYNSKPSGCASPKQYIKQPYRSCLSVIDGASIRHSLGNNNNCVPYEGA